MVFVIGGFAGDGADLMERACVGQAVNTFADRQPAAVMLTFSAKKGKTGIMRGITSNSVLPWSMKSRTLDCQASAR